jgi:hypothetical protein
VRALTGCRALGVAITVVALVSVMGTGGARIVTAGDTATTEQLQAALLMTLARFTEWPSGEFSSASAPLVVGFVADEAVAEAFELIARGKNVSGRPVVARRLQWDSDTTGTHVLLIGEAERRRLVDVLERVQRRPILTVSQLSEFGRVGGMITLKSSGGRVSFAVNSRAIGLSGLKLSSFLLSHATSVSEPAAPAAAR